MKYFAVVLTFQMHFARHPSRAYDVVVFYISCVMVFMSYDKKHL